MSPSGRPHHFGDDLDAGKGRGVEWRRMPTIVELRQTARDRLRDAKALLRKRRYDGGVYLCGYAVEIALKCRACKSLGWSEFPDGSAKNRGAYRSFLVHDLDFLLHLSGREDKIRATLLAEWSDVVKWDPEARYTPAGKITKSGLEDMIKSATALLDKLL